jgi:hypothetical protein
VKGDVGARARQCASERVALLIQYAKRRHIDICGPSGFTKFFDYLINGTIFSTAFI